MYLWASSWGFLELFQVLYIINVRDCKMQLLFRRFQGKDGINWKVRTQCSRCRNENRCNNERWSISLHQLILKLLRIFILQASVRCFIRYHALAIFLTRKYVEIIYEILSLQSFYLLSHDWRYGHEDFPCVLVIQHNFSRHEYV